MSFASEIVIAAFLLMFNKDAVKQISLGIKCHRNKTVCIYVLHLVSSQRLYYKRAKCKTVLQVLVQVFYCFLEQLIQ